MPGILLIAKLNLKRLGARGWGNHHSFEAAKCPVCMQVPLSKSADAKPLECAVQPLDPELGEALPPCLQHIHDFFNSRDVAARKRIGEPAPKVGSTFCVELARAEEIARNSTQPAS